MDSPGSPLSELSSDDFQEETRASIRSISADPFRDHELDGDSTRPTKRPRVGGGGGGSSAAGGGSAAGRGGGSTWENLLPPPSDADISSDTDGSVPGSPHPFAGDDEDGPAGREQVTICKWEGCPNGDLGNMDQLVLHIHDDHIQARQKRYACEWTDCSRKGIPHASGYALRAHMRSHTREKPFYCSLPECDRSFTRSDALAKHMRTVHETEALRPSDPVPKHHSSNPQNKSQRLRLTVKGIHPPVGNGDMLSAKDPLSAVKSNASNPASPSLQPHFTSAEMEYEHNNVGFIPKPGPSGGYDLQFPPDIHFTPAELNLSPQDLLRLLRRQLQWSMADGDNLRKEVEKLESQRKKEWESKELLLENLMEAEFAVEEKKLQTGLHKVSAVEEMDARMAVKGDLVPSKKLAVKAQKQPWWRESNGADAPAALS